MKRIAGLAVAVGLLSISPSDAPLLRHRSRTGTRFTESKGTLQGDIWLSWDHRTRDGFVRGFLVGYHIAWRGACSEAVSIISPREQQPIERDPYFLCEQHQPRFGKTPESYDQFVTDFYSSYPDDRDVPIRTLIEFADEKSLEQVHEWAAHLGDREPLVHR